MIISKVFAVLSLFISQVKSQETWGNNRFFYSASYPDLQRQFYVKQKVLISVASAASFTSLTISESTATCSFYSASNQALLLGTGGPVTSSTSSVYVSCPSAGSFSFSLYVNGNTAATDTFYLTVVNLRLEWYYAIYNSTTQTQNTFLYSGQSNYRLRFWLTDPTNLGAGEAAQTALTPSSNSTQLSSAFQSLGLTPVFSYDSLYFSLGSPSWNSAAGYWESQLNASSFTGSGSLTFVDQEISVVDMTVNPTSILIPIQKYSSTGLSLSTLSSSPSTTSGPLSLFSDACSPGIYFATSSLWGSSSLAYTQNSFSSLDAHVNNVYQIAGSSSLPVKSVSSNTGTLAILYGTNSVSYRNSAGELVSSSGIPSSSSALDKMQGPHYCDKRLNQASFTNAVVVAWSSTTTATSLPLYISQNGGVSFTSMAVNADITGTGTGGKVYDVAIDHTRATLCVLMRDGNGYDRILVVDLSNTANTTLGYNSGSTASILEAGVKGATPGMRSFPGGQLLVWGDSLNYSPDGGKTLFTVPLISRTPALPAAGLASSEYISDVVSCQDGAFAVLTSTNRVFYGQIGILSTIEVNAGITAAANVKLTFDNLSNLYVITASSTAPYLSRRLIPLSNEISSTRVPASSNAALTCPYSLWTFSAFSNYTLDVGDSVTISSYLVSSSSASNVVSVALANSSVVSQNISRSYPPENLDVISIEDATISVTPTTAGRSALVIQPKSRNLACPESQKVVRILAACPPTRTLVFYIPAPFTPAASPTPRYHKNRYKSSNYNTGTSSVATATPTISSSAGCTDSSFTVAAGQWYNRNTSSAGTTSLSVSSYCSTYGTPQEAYYGNPYRPSFAIFENNVFVKKVTADIGIWEVNGRSTYAFNATASSEGCRSDPISLKTGNFPSSYSACYSNSAASLTSSSKEYEIMNGTNGNSITWNGGVNGIYLFQAKVLDPKYSYCTLSTNFAVQVVGAPSDIGWQLLIVGLVDLIGLVTLVLSYFWYSSSRKFIRTEEFEKDKGRENGYLKKAKLE